MLRLLLTSSIAANVSSLGMSRRGQMGCRNEWSKRKNILTVLCLKITWNILPKMRNAVFCREIINA